MKSSQIAIVLIAVGSIFGVLSLLWPAAVGGKRAYSDDDAVEYQQASAKLHEQKTSHSAASDHHDDVESDGHSHNHADVTPNDSGLKAAQERMDAIEAIRDGAINRGQSTAGVFKWLGILTLAGGIITHFAASGRE